MPVNEPTKSYAIAKAERMYKQCKSFEEMAIIDRYAELAQPVVCVFGLTMNPLSGAQKACKARLTDGKAQ